MLPDDNAVLGGEEGRVVEPAQADVIPDMPDMDMDEARVLRDAMEVLGQVRAEAPQQARVQEFARAEPQVDDVEVIGRDRVNLQNSGPWGCFSFSLKLDTRYGSYEVSCPWHRKNSRTGCKKLFSVKTAGDEGLRSALWKARWWASQAREFELQAEHMFGANLCEEEMPSAEEIEARRIDERPSRQNILTDIDILARQAAIPKAQPKPKAASGALSDERSVSVAKAKAKPAPEQAARARAPASQPSDSDSDSDSSSSSSS